MAYTMSTIPSRFFVSLVLLCFISCFYSFPVFAAKKVGVVKAAKGNTTVVHEAEKKTAPLNKSDPLFLKDIVATGGNGLLQANFQDKTTLSLRENSRIVVMTSLYEIPGGKIKASVSRPGIQFKTPTAVIGVRGTELVLEVSKRKTKVFCLKGMLKVFNPLFPEKVISISAGKFTDVLLNKLPTLPAAIPAEILDLMGSQFNIPLSAESLKEKGFGKLRGKIPGF